MRDRERQHRHQNAYFNQEFSSINSYHLAPWQESYVNRIANHLLAGNPTGKTLLDIATGSGYVAIEMAKLGLNVTACDLSVVAIRNLNKYRQQYSLNNLNTIICPAEDIPMSDNSFDYIVANAILGHMYDEERTVQEWKRLLKPSGRLFITVPLMYHYLWPFLWPVNYIHDKRIGHLRRYNRASLQNKFQLKIKKEFYTGHLIKLIDAAKSTVFPNDKFTRSCEIQDIKKDHLPYGATNIILIMEKPA